MKTFLERARTVEVAEPAYTFVQDKLFGALDEATPTVRKNMIGRFKAIYDAEAEYVGQSAYALFNTVTGYADHAMIVHGRPRFNSILDGAAKAFKQTGIKAVETLVGATI
jgi:hypothetical protein